MVQANTLHHAETMKQTHSATLLCSRASILVPLLCRVHRLDVDSVQCNALQQSALNACAARNQNTPFQFSYALILTPPTPTTTTTNNHTTTIPTHLHQTWKTHEVHPVFQHYYQSWSKNHPSWTRQIWSDQDNRNLVEVKFPELLSFYDQLSHTILRVDVVRYLILYQHGGVYADMDIESLQPMDALLKENTKVLLGFESYEPSFTIEISLMGAIPKQPLWLKVIYEVILAVADPNVTSIFNTTGNVLFTRVVKRELLLHSQEQEQQEQQKHQQKQGNSGHHGIEIMPREIFFPPYPLRYQTRNMQRCRCGPVAPYIGYPCHACLKMYPTSYTLHHETGTWVHSWGADGL
jgi:mannosyltransferase OCH1-like enzyme